MKKPVKRKFKSGDLAENIHTNEIMMVDRIEYSRLGNQILYMVAHDPFSYIGIMAYNFRLISPKQIKINL